MDGEQSLPEAGRRLAAAAIRNKKLAFYQSQKIARVAYFRKSVSAEIADRAQEEWTNV